MEGLVTRTTGSWYRILSDGKTFDCRLRGNYRLRGNKQTNPVAVGDHVEFLLQDDGSGMINNVLDRRNYIVRKATKLSKQTHVIASNIDLLCVVASLAFPRTSTGFIDRLLVTAEAYHIPACIIFNKADLYDDENEDVAKKETDDEFEGVIEYECPHCGAKIEIDPDEVDFDEDALCPQCGKELFPELPEEGLDGEAEPEDKK